MNDPELRIAGVELPDAEVELTAEDLLELAGPCGENERAHAAPEKTITAAAMPSTSALQRRATPAVARRETSLWRVAVALPFALTAIGALYFGLVLKDDSGGTSALELAPQSELPASALESEGKPVLFANPFDANEVFEFPAGTSEAEARDAVAEILMERAMQRQRKFDARVSNNR
jgi:hypothetical protein